MTIKVQKKTIIVTKTRNKGSQILKYAKNTIYMKNIFVEKKNNHNKDESQ